MNRPEPSKGTDSLNKKSVDKIMFTCIKQPLNNI